MLLAPGAWAEDQLCNLPAAKLQEWRDNRIAESMQRYKNNWNEMDNFTWFGNCSAAQQARSCVEKADPAKAACLERFAAFSWSSCTSSDRQMGFGVTDNAYFAEANVMFGGKMMEIPKELQAAHLKEGNARAIEAEADKKGYKWLEYTTRFVTNRPHHSHNRLLIHVPGEDFDQWIQFTRPPNGRNIKEPLIDFIAIQKRSEAGVELKKPRIWFKGFWTLGNKIVRRGIPPAAVLTRCYGCHASGLRELVPATGSVTSQLAKTTLADFNKQMRGYGVPEFAGNYDPETVGPSYGASSKTNACMGCHNGEYKGLLSPGTLPRQIDYKMVHERTMPPQQQMSNADRRELRDELQGEMLKDLKAWLTEISCK